MSVALVVHVLLAVVWVGGMFFAYTALRPAAAALLEPPQRLPLWVGSFERFFPWVWGAVTLIPVTGYWMMFATFGGFKAPLYIHLMQGIGIVMIMVYLHVYFAPYRRLRQAVDAQDWTEGGRQLGKIRLLIGINLTLGLITVTIASAGRYLPGLV